MDKNQLTKSQLDFYDFITSYYRKHRLWPKWKVIMKHFGWKSPNSVAQYLESLTSKGYLYKDPEYGYRLTDKEPGEALHAAHKVEEEAEEGKADGK